MAEQLPSGGSISGDELFQKLLAKLGNSKKKKEKEQLTIEFLYETKGKPAVISQLTEIGKTIGRTTQEMKNLQRAVNSLKPPKQITGEALTRQIFQYADEVKARERLSRTLNTPKGFQRSISIQPADNIIKLLGTQLHGWMDNNLGTNEKTDVKLLKQQAQEIWSSIKAYLAVTGRSKDEITKLPLALKKYDADDILPLFLKENGDMEKAGYGTVEQYVNTYKDLLIVALHNGVEDVNRLVLDAITNLSQNSKNFDITMKDVMSIMDLKGLIETPELLNSLFNKLENPIAKNGWSNSAIGRVKEKRNQRLTDLASNYYSVEENDKQFKSALERANKTKAGSRWRTDSDYLKKTGYKNRFVHEHELSLLEAYKQAAILESRGIYTRAELEEMPGMENFSTDLEEGFFRLKSSVMTSARQLINDISDISKLSAVETNDGLSLTVQEGQQLSNEFTLAQQRLRAQFIKRAIPDFDAFMAFIEEKYTEEYEQAWLTTDKGDVDKFTKGKASSVTPPRPTANTVSSWHTHSRNPIPSAGQYSAGKDTKDADWNSWLKYLYSNRTNTTFKPEPVPLEAIYSKNGISIIDLNSIKTKDIKPLRQAFEDIVAEQNTSSGRWQAQRQILSDFGYDPNQIMIQIPTNVLSKLTSKTIDSQSRYTDDLIQTQQSALDTERVSYSVPTEGPKEKLKKLNSTPVYYTDKQIERFNRKAARGKEHLKKAQQQKEQERQRKEQEKEAKRQLGLAERMKDVVLDEESPSLEAVQKLQTQNEAASRATKEMTTVAMKAAEAKVKQQEQLAERMKDVVLDEESSGIDRGHALETQNEAVKKLDKTKKREEKAKKQQEKAKKQTDRLKTAKERANQARQQAEETEKVATQLAEATGKLDDAEDKLENAEEELKGAEEAEKDWQQERAEGGQGDSLEAGKPFDAGQIADALWKRFEEGKKSKFTEEQVKDIISQYDFSIPDIDDLLAGRYMPEDNATASDKAIEMLEAVRSFLHYKEAEEGKLLKIATDLYNEVLESGEDPLEDAGFRQAAGDYQYFQKGEELLNQELDKANEVAQKEKKEKEKRKKKRQEKKKQKQEAAEADDQASSEHTDYIQIEQEAADALANSINTEIEAMQKEAEARQQANQQATDYIRIQQEAADALANSINTEIEAMQKEAEASKQKETQEKEQKEGTSKRKRKQKEKTEEEQQQEKENETQTESKKLYDKLDRLQAQRFEKETALIKANDKNAIIIKDRIQGIDDEIAKIKEKIRLNQELRNAEREEQLTKDKNNYDKRIQNMTAENEALEEQEKIQKRLNEAKKKIEKTQEESGLKISNAENLIQQDNITAGNAEEYVQKVQNARVEFNAIAELMKNTDWTVEEEVQKVQARVAALKEMTKDGLIPDGAINADADAISKLSQKLISFQQGNNLKSNNYNQITEWLTQLKDPLTVDQLNDINSAFNRMQVNIKGTSEEGASFTSKVAQRFQSLAAYLSTFVSFYEVIGQIKQGLGIIHDLDDALTEMAKVSDEPLSRLQQFQAESYNIANAAGTTGLVIQQSTADFMRLGQSLDEAQRSAKNASILLNVSEFQSISEATDALIAMSAAYDELPQEDILDKLNNIGNNFAISTEGLATALQNSAATLRTAGNDIDESIALITAGNQIIQDPNKVGNAFRTVALRITGTKEAKDQLAELGEDVDDFVVQTEAKSRQIIKDYTAVASNSFKGVDILDENGNFRSTYQILQDIADVYEEIVETDKKYGTNRSQGLLETLAGKNRANVIASVLQSPDVLRSVYEASQDSFGSAEEELEKYKDSISGHLAEIQNKWQQAWTTVGNRDQINFFIDMGSAILDVVNKIGLLQTALPTIALIYGTILKAGGKGQGIGEFIKSGINSLNKTAFEIPLKGKGDETINAAATVAAEEAKAKAKEKSAEASMKEAAAEQAEAAANAEVTASSTATVAGETAEAVAKTESAEKSLLEEVAEEAETKTDAKVATSSLAVAAGETAEAAAKTESAGASTALATANQTLAVSYGMVLAGALAVAVAIYALVKANAANNMSTENIIRRNNKLIEQDRKRTQGLKDSIKEYKNNADSLKSLYERYQEAEVGSQEYYNIREQIASQFPTLISGYDDEGRAIIANNDAIERQIEKYNQLATAKQNALKEETRKNINRQTGNTDEFITNFLGMDRTGKSSTKELAQAKKNLETRLAELREQDGKQIAKELSDEFGNTYSFVQEYDFSNDPVAKQLEEELEEVTEQLVTAREELKQSYAILADSIDANNQDLVNAVDSLETFATLSDLSAERFEEIIYGKGGVGGLVDTDFSEKNNIGVLMDSILNPDLKNIKATDYFHVMQTQLSQLRQELGLTEEEWVSLSENLGISNVQKVVNDRISSILSGEAGQIAKNLGIDLEQTLKEMSVSEVLGFRAKDFYTNKFAEDVKANFRSLYDDIKKESVSSLSEIDWSQMVGPSAMSSLESLAEQYGLIKDNGVDAFTQLISIMTDLQWITDDSAEGLTNAFNTWRSSAEETIQSMSAADTALNKAFSEQAKNGNVTKETYAELIAANASYQQALKQTSTGLQLDVTQARHLRDVERQQMRTDLTTKYEELQQTYNNNQAEIDRLVNEYQHLDKAEEKRAEELLNEINSYLNAQKTIQDQVSSLQDLQAEYANTTSAYQAWQDAISNGNYSDQYDTITGWLETYKKLHEQKRYGNDDYEAFTRMFYGDVDFGIGGAAEKYPQISDFTEKYFTEDRKGPLAMLKSVKEAIKQEIEKDPEGGFAGWILPDGSLDLKNLDQLSMLMTEYFKDSMGDDFVFTSELMDIFASAWTEFGLGDYLKGDKTQTADELEKSITSMEEMLGGLEEGSYKWQLYSQAIENAKLQLLALRAEESKYKSSEEINGLVDTVNTGLEASGSDKKIEVPVVVKNADEAQKTIDDLNEAKNELVEVVDEGEEGAVIKIKDQEAYDSINELIEYYQQQKEIFDNQPFIMSVNTDSIQDERVANFVKKLQELKLAYDALHAAETPEERTTAWNNISSIVNELKEIDKETGGELTLGFGLDLNEDMETQIQSINHLVELTESEDGTEVKIIFNTDQPSEALQGLQETINSIADTEVPIIFKFYGPDGKEVDPSSFGLTVPDTGSTQGQTTSQESNQSVSSGPRGRSQTSATSSAAPREQAGPPAPQNLSQIEGEAKAANNAVEELNGKTVNIDTSQAQENIEVITAERLPDLEEEVNTVSDTSVDVDTSNLQQKLDDSIAGVGRLSEEIQNLPKPPTIEQTQHTSAPKQAEVKPDTSSADNGAKNMGAFASAIQAAQKKLAMFKSDIQNFKDSVKEVFSGLNLSEGLEVNTDPLQESIAGVATEFTNLQDSANNASGSVSSFGSNSSGVLAGVAVDLENATNKASDLGSTVDQTSNKELGDFGAPNTNDQVQSTINKVGEVGSAVDSAKGHKLGDLGANSAKSSVDSLKSSIAGVGTAMNNINGKTATLTIKVNQSGGGGIHTSGGTLMEWMGNASFAKGTIGADKTEKALTGELGPELRVRGRKWELLGENGPEFNDVRRGDIIFNADQTEDLLTKGHTNSRGKAFAFGTSGAAYVTTVNPDTVEGSGGKTTKTKKTSSKSKGTSSKDKKGKNSDSDSKKTNKSLENLTKTWKQFIDWSETFMSDIQRKIEHFTNLGERTYEADSKRIKNFDKAIVLMKKQIDATEKQETLYRKRANTVFQEGRGKLGKKAKAEIDEAKSIIDKGGVIDIKKYSEDAQTVIEEYQNWHDKAEEAKYATDELKTSQKELMDQKFELQIQTLKDYNSQLDAANEKIETQISFREKFGLSATNKQLDKQNGLLGQQIQNNYGIIQTLKEQRNQYEKGTEKYRELSLQIQETENNAYSLLSTMHDIAATKFNKPLDDLEKFNERMKNANSILDIFSGGNYSDTMKQWAANRKVNNAKKSTNKLITTNNDIQNNFNESYGTVQEFGIKFKNEGLKGLKDQDVNKALTLIEKIRAKADGKKSVSTKDIQAIYALAEKYKKTSAATALNGFAQSLVNYNASLLKKKAQSETYEVDLASAMDEEVKAYIAANNQKADTYNNKQEKLNKKNSLYETYNTEDLNKTIRLEALQSMEQNDKARLKNATKEAERYKTKVKNSRAAVLAQNTDKISAENKALVEEAKKTADGENEIPSKILRKLEKNLKNTPGNEGIALKDFLVACHNYNSDIQARDTQGVALEIEARQIKQEKQQRKRDKLQLEIEDYQNQRSTLDAKNANIQSKIALREAVGKTGKQSSYLKMNDNISEEIRLLEKENEALKKQQKTVNKGSTEWYKYQQQIIANKTEMNNLTASMIANTKAILDNIAAQRDLNIGKNQTRLDIISPLYHNETGKNKEYFQSYLRLQNKYLYKERKEYDKYVNDTIKTVNEAPNKATSKISNALSSKDVQNNKEYYNALKNAQKQLAAGKSVKEKDLEVIQKNDGSLASLLWLCSNGEEAIETARLAQLQNYTETGAKLFENINADYTRQHQINQNYIDKHTAKMENKSTAVEKNKSLSTINNYIDANVDVAREKTAAFAKEKRKASALISSFKARGSYKQWIQAAMDCVSNDRAIGAGILDRLAQGVVDGAVKVDFLKACYTWNDAIEWHREAAAQQILEEEAAKKEKRSNALQAVQNIATEGQNKRQADTQRIAERQSLLQMDEAMGYYGQVSRYEEQLGYQANNLVSLQTQLADMEKQLNKNIATVPTYYGSQEYYDTLNLINQTRNEIYSTTLEIRNLKNEVRALDWKKFDDLMSKISRLHKEMEHYQSLLSNEMMFNDNMFGSITTYGMASLDLHNSSMLTYISEAHKYLDEIEDLNSKIASGEYDQYDMNVIARKEQLVDAYWEMGEAAENEKQAMIDLARQGYESQLSYLNKLISKYKELQDQEKSAYEYQKQIAESTKSITDLQKQLKAYEGNTTEEARATIQKLRNDLKEAEQNKQDIQYDRYISESQRMLDDLSTNFENWINEYMNDRNQVIADLQNELAGDINGLSTTTENLKDRVDANGEQILGSTNILGETIETVSEGTLTDTQTTLKDIDSFMSENLATILDADNTELGATLNSGLTSSISPVLLAVNGVEASIYALASAQQALAMQALRETQVTATPAEEKKKTVDTSSSSTTNDDSTTKKKEKKKTEEKKEVTLTLKNSDSVELSIDGIDLEDNTAEAVPSYVDLQKNLENVAATEQQAKALKAEISELEKKRKKNEKELKKAQDNLNKLKAKKNPNQNKVTNAENTLKDLQNEKNKLDKELQKANDKLKALPSYMKGSYNVPHNGFAWTQEQGQEVIYRKADGALLTPLDKGDKVFTAAMTDNLWKMAQMNIHDMITSSFSQPVVANSTVTNTISPSTSIQMTINLPNVTNYDDFKTALLNDNKFQNSIQAMTLGAAMKQNSLSKFKYS